MQVKGRLVCTQRVAGLGHMHLRILRNNKGKDLVAVDPVGAREGNLPLGSSLGSLCSNIELSPL